MLTQTLEDGEPNFDNAIEFVRAESRTGRQTPILKIVGNHGAMDFVIQHATRANNDLLKKVEEQFLLESTTSMLRAIPTRPEAGNPDYWDDLGGYADEHGTAIIDLAKCVNELRGANGEILVKVARLLLDMERCCLATWSRDLRSLQSVMLGAEDAGGTVLNLNRSTEALNKTVALLNSGHVKQVRASTLPVAPPYGKRLAWVTTWEGTIFAFNFSFPIVIVVFIFIFIMHNF